MYKHIIKRTNVQSIPAPLPEKPCIIPNRHIAGLVHKIPSFFCKSNLSPIQRIAVAEKYRPIYEKMAKEKLSTGGRNGGLTTQNKPLTNLSNPSSAIDTTQKLADMAGVSRTTYRMGAKVLNSDNEDVKNRVLSGETSISAGYKEHSP